MPNGNNYLDKIFGALNGAYSESGAFTLSKEEFASKIESDTGYASKIFSALDNAYGVNGSIQKNAFTLSKDDFFKKIYKEQAPKIIETEKKIQAATAQKPLVQQTVFKLDAKPLSEFEDFQKQYDDLVDRYGVTAQQAKNRKPIATPQTKGIVLPGVGLVKPTGETMNIVSGVNASMKQEAQILSAAEERANKARAELDKQADILVKNVTRDEQSRLRFMLSNNDGFMVPNDVAISDYVNLKIKDAGGVQNGLSHEYMKNKLTAALASYDLMEKAQKRTDEQFAKKHGGKSLQDLVTEQANKASANLFAMAKKEKEAVVESNNLSRKKDIDQALLPVNEAITKITTDIDAAGKRAQEEIALTKSAFESNQMSADEANAKIKSIQDQYQTSYNTYKQTFDELSLQSLSLQGDINSRYNRAYAKRKQEIEYNYSLKVKELQKQFGKADPALVSEYTKMFQQNVSAVQSEMSKVKNAYLKYKYTRGTDFGNILTSPGLYISDFISGFGSGALKPLATALDWEWGQKWGDYISNSFVQSDDASISQISDLLDPVKFSKATFGTLGGMAPTLVAGAVTAVATGGASIPAQLAIQGGVGMAIETAQNAGAVKDQVFRETGSLQKANRAADITVKDNLKKFYLYFAEGIPFIGKISLGIKGAGILPTIGRAVVKGGIETGFENVQEFYQGGSEKRAIETIRMNGEEVKLSNYTNIIENKPFKDSSDKTAMTPLDRFYETGLNVLPATMFMGGAGEVGRYAVNKAFYGAGMLSAIKNKMGDVSPNFHNQYIYDMYLRRGENYTAGYITSLRRQGLLTQEEFTDIANKFDGMKSVADIASKNKLKPGASKVLMALQLDVNDKKATLDASTNETEKDLAQVAYNKSKGNLDAFIKGKNPDYIVVRLANNEQYILTYGEAEEMLSDPDFINKSKGAVQFHVAGSEILSNGQNIYDLLKQKYNIDRPTAPAEMTTQMIFAETEVPYVNTMFADLESRMTNAEEIPGTDIDIVLDGLYEQLEIIYNNYFDSQAGQEAAKVISDKIDQLQSYEFRTGEETTVAAERPAAEAARRATEERRGIIDRTSGTSAAGPYKTVTVTTGFRERGAYSISFDEQDRVVLNPTSGAPIVLGFRGQVNKAIKFVSANFGKNGMPTSLTFRIGIPNENGVMPEVTMSTSGMFTQEELLDILIDMRAAEVGEVTQEDFDNAYNSITRPDAIQEQTAGEVPVQPEAGTRETVAERAARTGPEKTAQAGQAQVQAQEGAPQVTSMARGQVIVDPIRNIQSALRGLGVDVMLIEDPAEYDRVAKAYGQDAETEGMFIGSDGKIYLNAQYATDPVVGETIIYHEGAHPIINLIRNTNPRLYSSIVGQIKAMQGRPEMADIFNFANNEEYRKKGEWAVEDELVVETIARLASGALDPKIFSPSLLEKIVELLNKVGSILRLPKIKNIASAEARQAMNKIVTSLRTGADITKEFGTGSILAPGDVQRRVTGMTLANDGVMVTVNGTEEIIPGQNVATVVIPKTKTRDVELLVDLPFEQMIAGDIAPSSSIVSLALKFATGSFTYKDKTTKKDKTFQFPYINKNAQRQIIKLRAQYSSTPKTKDGNAIRNKISKKISDITKGVLSDVTDVMAQNILALYDTLSDEFIQYSKEWYVGANRIANAMARTYDLGLEQTAGIIAALSPQNEWFNNVSAAERVIDVMRNHSDLKFTNDILQKVRDYHKGKKTSFVTDVELLFDSYQGMSINDMQAAGVSLQDQANLLRSISHALHSPRVAETDPTGKFIGIGKNVIRWNSADEISKAIRIFRNGSIDAINESLGDGNKIRNFANNIADPYSDKNYLTADTHATAVVVNGPISASDASGMGIFNGGPEASYVLVKDAYIKAAKVLGLLPRELQSITWEAIRTGINNDKRTPKDVQKAYEYITESRTNDKTPYERATEHITRNPSKNPGWAQQRGIDVQRGSNEISEGARDRAEQRIRALSDVRGQLEGGRRAAVSGMDRRATKGANVQKSVVQPSNRRLAPLEGAPTPEGATGPDPSLVAVAEKYASENNIPYRRQAEYVKSDPERGKRIAQEYEEMKHDPKNPVVIEAYNNLIDQTKKQYDALVDAGYEFTFFDSKTDPYKGNPVDAMRDLRKNKRMAVYGTYDGYGTEGVTGAAIEGNPMLQDTGLMWPDQSGVMKPVTANDLFRAVHDAFGHGLEGAGFRARGEENAWQAHVRLFTGSAIAAITTETRGQNSWLNYGPYGEKNRTAKLEDTVFAEQKTGLMPEWTWTEGVAEDMAAAPGVQPSIRRGTALIGPDGNKLVSRGDYLKLQDIVSDVNHPIYGPIYNFYLENGRDLYVFGGRGDGEGIANYSALTKRISFNVNHSKFTEYYSDQGVLDMTVAHEIIHSIVDEQIRKNQQDFVAFNSQLLELKDVLSKQDTSSLDTYLKEMIGYVMSGSPEEMVAYALTDPAVAAYFNSIEVGPGATGDTIWSRIVKLLLSIAGKAINRNSLLSAVTDTFNAYTQTLGSAQPAQTSVAGARNLISGTYYEPNLTTNENGEYVFFHVSTAPEKSILKGIDSRKFQSLRTSREEKGLQYGIASFYTKPTDSERVVGGDKYYVTVAPEAVYPMDTDPNGYRVVAEKKVKPGTPFREEKVKKAMAELAAKDGYQMAVAEWAYDRAGRSTTELPALRADALIKLVPKVYTGNEDLKTGAERGMTTAYPDQQYYAAKQDLSNIASDIESARSKKNRYDEVYDIASKIKSFGGVIENYGELNEFIRDLNEEEFDTLYSGATSKQKQALDEIKPAYMSGKTVQASAVAARGDLSLGKINWEKSVEGKGDPSISSRNPVVVKAAQDLKGGKITNEEYRATVSANSPIMPITRFFEPATLEEIKRAFVVSTKKDSEAENIDKPVEDGEKVGLRLDIPSYKFNNTWVVSVHKGYTQSGKILSYTNVAKIKNVSFEPIPAAALNIATGEKSKTSVARMYGEWEKIPGDTMAQRGENAKNIVQSIVNDPNYVQVGMNPFRHSYFYDRSSDIGRPIVSADEVIQIGGLVYAKNPVYGNWTDEAFKVKNLFDAAGFSVQFSARGNRQIGQITSAAAGATPLFRRLRAGMSDMGLSRFAPGIENKGLRDMISLDDRKFYTPISWSKIKDKLDTMSEADLIDAMDVSDPQTIWDNIIAMGGPAAPLALQKYMQIQFAKRQSFIAAGNTADATRIDQDIKEKYISLKQFGTILGQALGMYRVLKSMSSNTDFHVDAIEAFIDATGGIITKDQRAMLRDNVDAVLAARLQYESELQRINKLPAPTDSDMAVLNMAEAMSINASTKLNLYISTLMQDEWSNIYGSAVKGGLLYVSSVLLSLQANVMTLANRIPEASLTNMIVSAKDMISRLKVGRPVSAGIKAVTSVNAKGLIKALETLIEEIKKFATNPFKYISEKITDIRNSISNYKSGINNAGILTNAADIILYGSQEHNDRMVGVHTKMNPATSMMRVLSSKGKPVLDIKGMVTSIEQSYKKSDFTSWLSKNYYGMTYEEFAKLDQADKESIKDQFFADKKKTQPVSRSFFKDFAKGTSGALAELNFRMLALTDYVPKSLMESHLLERVGHNLGITGVDLELFKHDPFTYAENHNNIISPEALNYIYENAAELTMAKETGIGKLSVSMVNFIKNMPKIIAKNNFGGKDQNAFVDSLTGATSAVVDTTMPYVQLPMNATSYILDFAFPIKPMAKSYWFFAMSKEARRRGKDNVADAYEISGYKYMSRAIIGGAFSVLATAIVTVPGLVRLGSPQDEDDEERKMNKTLGTNSLNVSALRRYVENLAGISNETTEYRPGDTEVDLKNLGVLGMMIYGYGNAYKKSRKKYMESKFSNDMLNRNIGENKKLKDLAWSGKEDLDISDSFNLSYRSIKYMLDQSWFMSIANIAAVFNGRDDDGYAMNKLISGYIGTAASSIPLFSAYAKKASDLVREGKNVPTPDINMSQLDDYDVDMTQTQLYNSLSNRNYLMDVIFNVDPYDDKYISFGMFGKAATPVRGGEQGMPGNLWSITSPNKDVISNWTDVQRFYYQVYKQKEMLDIRGQYSMSLTEPKLNKKETIVVPGKQYDEMSISGTFQVPSKDYNELMMLSGKATERIINTLGYSWMNSYVDGVRVVPEDLENPKTADTKEVSDIRKGMAVSISEANKIVNKFLKPWQPLKENDAENLKFLGLSTAEKISKLRVMVDSIVIEYKEFNPSTNSVVDSYVPLIDQDITDDLRELGYKSIEMYVRELEKAIKTEEMIQEMNKREEVEAEDLMRSINRK